jgi:predicted hydrocarbon binding protein
MSEIPKIPDEALSEIRRQMSVRSIPGFNAILLGLGVNEETLNKGRNMFWKQGGKEFAEIAKNMLKLGENLVDVQTATLASCQVYGIETGEMELGNRGTITKCPFIGAIKEFGLNEEFCLAPCKAFVTAITKSFNPMFSVERTKAIPKGDDVCEYVWKE